MWKNFASTLVLILVLVKSSFAEENEEGRNAKCILKIFFWIIILD